MFNGIIHMVKVVFNYFGHVNNAIEHLIVLASKNQDIEVVRQMKRIVPEYISNNSIYESMDEQRQTGPLYGALKR